MAITQAQLNQIYQQELGRAPDPAGAQYWLGGGTPGGTTLTTPEAIREAIRASTEAQAYRSQQNQGGTGAGAAAERAAAENLVASAFQNVLGRTPDAAGKDYWVNEILAGRSSPASLSTQIAYGAVSEDRAAANRWAISNLGAPIFSTTTTTTNANANAEADRLAAERAAAERAAAERAAAERAAAERAAAAKQAQPQSQSQSQPQPNREDAITALYTRILGRSPDAAGLAYYLTGGGKDLPLSEVERLFKASPELNPASANPVAARRSGLNELYRTVLGRDPDTPGLDYYLSGAGKELPLSRVSELLRDSSEFKERFPKFTTAQKQFTFPTEPQPQEILGITGRPTTPRGIADLYQRFLGRAPDPAGLQFYAEKFGPTMTPQRVSDFIGDIYGPTGEIARRGGVLPEAAFRGPIAPPQATTLTYGSQQVSPFGFVAPTAPGTTAVAPAPVGGQAGGLVTYQEGGMPKLSAKDAGSQFNMSEFLDEQGRLVGGFLRPESRPDRKVPDEYGAYGRPVRDESGKITNYEFVPYQSNVVFNPRLSEAEARGMTEDEKARAIRNMQIRMGLTDPIPQGIISTGIPANIRRSRGYELAEGGLASLAENLADKGRGGDSMLVHMSPEEVQGLRGLAMRMGGDLSINPQTGLVEAKFFKKLLPFLPFLIPGVGAAIAGFGKSAFGLSALASKSIAAGLIGGFTAPGKGFNFKAGLRTGIMAFAGGKLAEGLQAAGQTGVSTGPGSAGGTTAPSMPRAITADQIMANNPNMFPADAAQAASNLNTATQTAMGAPATVPSGLPTTPTSPGFLPPDAALEMNVADLGRPAPPIPTETGAQLPPAEVAAASQVPAGTPSLTTTPTVQGVKEAGTGFKNIISGSPEASAAFTQAVGVRPSTALAIGATTAAALAPDPEEEERKRLAEEQRQRQKIFDALYSQSLGRISMGAGGGIVALANGGMPTFEYGGTTAPTGEPRMVQGAGDGMSDNVPANIEGVQEARLANDEFVVPADVVADIGNGSSNAGAKKLYAMMDRIRKARHGTTEQPPEINAERLMPA